ncbi:protein of unknown function [Arthrobacter alpinus]|uniref:Uncharacterized protein n=1 Tax=Arthrobacter alpinus TaxID=656366 RepID=A0A0U3R088_9MICC|nr:DUF4193 family protein [Arthrobacter alpinus]ALV45429.1 hypothetical protein MB46_07935 [Arthrobacter alpinus]SEE23005.1 protein of unknown function [Arthrobacter alpinus]
MTTGFHRPRASRRQTGPAAANNAHGTVPNKAALNAVIDVADTELAESYELPGGELPPDELALEILAEQLDEFTCSSCFLVRHRSQLAREKNGLKFCKDCEG